MSERASTAGAEFMTPWTWKNGIDTQEANSKTVGCGFDS
jgi:hypothetical protein